MVGSSKTRVKVCFASSPSPLQQRQARSNSGLHLIMFCFPPGCNKQIGYNCDLCSLIEVNLSTQNPIPKSYTYWDNVAASYRLIHFCLQLFFFLTLYLDKVKTDIYFKVHFHVCHSTLSACIAGIDLQY